MKIMKKQIKVAYFPSNTAKDVVLGSNGKSLDEYCTKCETEEDLPSGNYVLDATFLIEDDIQDLLHEEAILKVLMDYGYEIFRITKPNKGTRYIDIVARQITITDSSTLWLEDVRPTNQSGTAAADWLVTNSIGVKEIEISSDIAAVSTAYYPTMSLYKALHDCDQSFLNRWGGEIQRRGYIEYINSHIGINRGFVIREGKNLNGFNGSSNIDNLITRARGKGYNGLLGNYIDSPLINNYNRVYTDIIEYQDVKIKDENSDDGYDTEALAIAELDRRINLEYSNNDIDKIKASYDLNFVQLEKTQEYKNYAVAEKAYLGDSLRVYIPRLKIDITVRVTNKQYDCLAQKTKETKLSSYVETKALSMKAIIADLRAQYTQSNSNNIASYIDAIIKAGMQGSYVVCRKNELLIMDSTDLNTAVNVTRYNKNGLAFSTTGYYGTYAYGFTIDGKINASLIVTGILNAGVIKAGILMSANNKTWINMEDGTFDFADKITFDGTNFRAQAKTSCFEVTDEHARFTGADGSYTEFIPSDTGLKWHKQVGDTGKDYHYLTCFGTFNINATSSALITRTIQLPDEFKGKDFKVLVTLENVRSQSGSPGYFLGVGCFAWDTDYDIANGTFKVYAGQEYTADNNYNYIDVGYIAIA